MNKTIIYNGYNQDYIVPVSDRIPAGFEVWNIGDHAPDGYILAARVFQYTVNMATLCAIPVSDQDRKAINAATPYGCNNARNTRRIAARIAHNINTTTPRKLAAVTAAIEVYARLCE